MVGTLDCDICVIGAGSAGLTVAAGAAGMGAATVLFERGRMGGDCLNYGCVPSKALLAAARTAEAMRQAERFGIGAVAPAIDFRRVHDHVHGVIAAIAPHDSEERFRAMGVDVVRQSARFVGPREVEAEDGRRVRARRFVIATGSSPALPPVAGLAGVPHFTNETIFDNADCPAHLIVLGGGPIGMEMAQAHRRLGARVTVLEMATVLGADDPELVAVVKARLGAEGVDIREGVRAERAAATAGGVAVTLAGHDGGTGETIDGSHLLVAAGRRPNVEDLGLEAAEIDHSPAGIGVDARLRTSNRRVFAIGDVVTGGPQFTHAAAYQASIVMRNALYRLPARVDYRALPSVTFTDPELAQVGPSEARARESHGRVRVLRWPFADNDRAQTERATEGLVKVVTGRGGRVLGAGIVGAQAGELLLPWVLAVGRRLRIGAMANLIAPYPTLSEAGKRAAVAYFIPLLFSPRTRKILKILAKFG